MAGPDQSVSISLLEGMRFEAIGQDGVPVSLDSSSDHGGTGSGLRPMELLLAALGSCTAMDVVSILRKKRQNVTGYHIEVRGVQQDDYPHVFTEISIRHVITGNDVSDDAVRRAIELSEFKYCPAFAMLSKAARIRSSYELRQPEPVPAD